MTRLILLSSLVSFALSWVLTLLMKRLAPRIGFVDKPGGRKIHANPKPLGGGVAIFLGLCIPMLLVLLAARMDWIPAAAAEHAAGIRHQTPLALAILGCMLGLHIVGLIDDRRALGPYSKLVVQLLAAAALVVFFNLRAVSFMGEAPSIILSILWIAGITNAFNFLDNMDGLSAGVAAVASVAFLVTALLIGQWFVAGMLALLLGSLLGFLCFNSAPASIFMGDCGSLVIGFALGVLTIMTNYLPHGADLGGGWYALFTPLIVLAVPLYDLLVVSAIRISRGKSPFMGDTNHFSHRLVARGMSRRTAVWCIYLVTAATAVAAIVLPRTDALGAILIFVQTLLVLGVVMLLELHPLPRSR
jgi:UDP-GlcNAc:undecaprenyl-phosphate GlcNAc-1-phosphate transferase